MAILHSFLKIGNRILGRLASYSYNLARLRSFLHFLLSERKEPLLVYQMGKVGSSTLLASLRASPAVCERYSIYHVHLLSAGGLQFMERYYAKARARIRRAPPPRRPLRPEHAWLARWLRKRILDSRNKHKWSVITMVREPIGRNVSSFFQNLELGLGYDYRSRLQSEGKEAVVADVRRLFDENYLDGRAIERIDSSPLTWFDSELKPIFGLDVFASQFPTRKGYQIYETERARVLLIRLEDLDRSHAEALKEFLQIDEFALVRVNLGEAKEYSELYRAFLRDLTLPAEYIDELYESRYSRHFYTDREIEIFRGRWKKRAPSSGPPAGRPA